MKEPLTQTIPKPPLGMSGWPWFCESNQSFVIKKESSYYQKISIITPSYNQGQFLEKTIRSVLLQNYPNLEYIIIDGGSTDKSVDVIKKYESFIHYWISEKDNGQTHAINKGFKKANGQIIGWLNSDDTLLPNTLHTINAFFSANRNIQILYGNADHIDINEAIIEPYPTENWDYDRLKISCFLCQPAVFYRKEILDTFGYLDETLNYCMDYEFWLRVGREIPFYYLNKKLSCSRLYSENKTLGSRVAVHNEILHMFKKKFGRVPMKWLSAYAYILTGEKKYDLDLFWGKRRMLFFWILQRHKNLLKFNKELFMKEWYIELKVIIGGKTAYYFEKISYNSNKL